MDNLKSKVEEAIRNSSLLELLSFDVLDDEARETVVDSIAVLAEDIAGLCQGSIDDRLFERKIKSAREILKNELSIEPAVIDEWTPEEVVKAMRYQDWVWKPGGDWYFVGIM